MNTQPVLYARQRLLLSLLNTLQGDCAATEFQKYLFLFTQEFEAKPSYDFVPYLKGCFSFTACADQRKLIALGLLENDEQRWALTAAGEAAVRTRMIAPVLLAEFRKRYGTLKGKSLCRDIAARYPYYADRSEVTVDGVVPGPGRVGKEGVQFVATEPALLTIGYEGKSLEAYLNQLLQAGVTLLCDVRRNPLSRKYGFSKSTLQPMCQRVGIHYEHLPELGIASQRRQTLDVQADYDRLFADYTRHDLPLQGGALETIAHWVTAGKMRNTRDSRPESFRLVDPDGIAMLGKSPPCERACSRRTCFRIGSRRSVLSGSCPGSFRIGLPTPLAGKANCKFWIGKLARCTGTVGGRMKRPRHCRKLD